MSDVDRPEVTGLALCAGIGGLELGLGAAIPGYRCVGYVERESFAAAVLLARMEEEALEPAPVWAGDLADFDAGAFAGVDLVSAGFPCQPWSVAGNQQGDEDERWLWDEIVQCLREIRPRWIVLENVPGLVSGAGIGLVLSDLAVLGYDAEWGVLAAESVGAPHRRKRVFIFAHRLADAGGDTVREQSERDQRSGRRVRTPVGGDAVAGEPGPAVAQPVGTGPQGEPIGAESRGRRGVGNPPGPAGPGGGELAVAEGERLEGRGSGTGGEPLGGPALRGRSQSARPAVAYSSGERLAGLGLEERGEHEGAHGSEPVGHGADGRFEGAGRLPLFPPGPNDSDLWQRVLAESYETQPALCRLANGPAGLLVDRVDRLRAYGNAVVPLQAATAIYLLWRRSGCPFPGDASSAE